MTRRQAIKTTALATIAAAASPGAIAQTSSPAAAPPFTLPPLPYALDALEPHIDARTMEIHHSKHHKAYVDNLNKAMVDWSTSMFASEKHIEDLLKDWAAAPEKIRTAVCNNGGGHYNHSLFWQMMQKDGGGEPKGELAKAIAASFGTFAAFQENFGKAATSRFGSGWAWLVAKQGNLEIVSTANQDSPLMNNGGIPLLGLDVWEHA